MLSQPHPSSPFQELPLQQHSNRMIQMKELLPNPRPQPPLQDDWQFVAAKSLMNNTSRGLITLYSMRKRKKSSKKKGDSYFQSFH